MPDSAGEQPGSKILVVDDAEHIRKLVCAMLRQSGFGCLEAGDGEEALRVLDSSDPILVLTDVVMPKMGGTELAEYLAQRRPDLPVVFMSGYADLPMVQSVRETHAGFLPKPFTAAALVEKIRRALDGA